MKRHTLLLLSLFVFASAAAAQQFPEGTVTRVDASRGVAAAVGRDGWFGWKVPLAEDVTLCCRGGQGAWDRGCCNGCRLDGSGFSSTNNSETQGSGVMLVMARMSDGRLTKVRAFDGECTIKTGAIAIRLLDNVSPEVSLEFLAQHIDDPEKEGAVLAVIAHHEAPGTVPLLERFAGRSSDEEVREQAVFWLGQRGGERGFQFLKNLVRSREESRNLKKKAVFAISQSDVPAAIPELIDLARHHSSSDIRRDAIFWLGQKAGDKATKELKRAVDEDPEDDVREHAVFAISQLPKERSVPLLIDLVRTHKSAGVREKALFWLAQTGDPRAIDLIEEILMR